MDPFYQASPTPDAARVSKDAPARKTGVATGVIAGALMVGIGLIAALAPGFAGLSLAYLVTAGIGVYGAAQLAAFFQAPAGTRSKWTLIAGVLLVGSSLFTIWSSLQSAYGPLNMIASLSVAAAVFSFLLGITQFFSFGELREHQAKGAGWVLAGGVLNALLGIALLTNPIAGWMALSTAWGLYLGVSGAAVIAESLSERKGRRCDT